LLNFSFVNLNSLINKLDFLLLHCNDYKAHVVGIAETWLLPDTPSSYVSLPGYDVVRGDTDGVTRKHGVCIYVSKVVKYIEVDIVLPNAAAILLTDVNVWCLVIYRPPSYDFEENARLINFLIDFCDGREVVIFGDFNLPSLKWKENILNGYITPTDLNFLECFNTIGLTQWVDQPTLTTGNTLDLVLTTETDRVGDVSVLPPFPHCVHCPVVFQYIFSYPLSLNPETISSFLWHKGRYADIQASLAEVDWDFEFDLLTPNECFLLLQHRIVCLVDRYVPKRSGRPSQPWSSRPPRRMIDQRSEAWTKYKQTRSSHGRAHAETIAALHTFNVFNSRCRNYSVWSRSQYEGGLMEQFKVKPKLFHSYIRAKKVGRPTVGPVRLEDGDIISDPFLMSEVFASKFASVFVHGDPVAPAPHQMGANVMADVTISQADVCSVLSALDSSSSMGPDSIHPCLLKSCAAALTYPLWLVFTRSLSDGMLPVAWKQSHVVPMYKSKSRYDPLNYRPISLTSVCCKTMERIVASHLMSFLEGEGILSENQFGFRRHRSTEDQLLLTYGDVSEWLDQGLVVDLILLDFSKAFDVVSHSVLLQKLQSLGVSDQLVVWIADFLVGREMIVSCGGALSSPRAVLSGVPQGSVLGPVLFLVYVNHISSTVSCKFKAFADDYKLYLQYSRRDLDEVALAVSSLQRDLDAVQQMASSWNLNLNPDKCVVMRFNRGKFDWSTLEHAAHYSLGGNQLSFVDSHRDLGVVVDNKLKFNLHVHTVVQKASSLAMNLLKSTVNRSPPFMVSLFVSHIRPILDYCSCVWNTEYIGNLRMLESVQRRWTKKIEGFSDLTYAHRLERLDLFSVFGRLVRSDLIKYWKSLRSDEDVGLAGLFDVVQDGRTRGHPLKLQHPRFQTECRRRFFSSRRVALWNLLPTNVVLSPSLPAFKSNLLLAIPDVLFFYYD
jgi:hypothetical protein